MRTAASQAEVPHARGSPANISVHSRHASFPDFSSGGRDALHRNGSSPILTSAGVNKPYSAYDVQAPLPPSKAHYDEQSLAIEMRMQEVRELEAALAKRRGSLEESEGALHRHWVEATRRAQQLDDLAQRLMLQEHQLEARQRALEALDAELHQRRTTTAAATAMTPSTDRKTPLADLPIVQELQLQLDGANALIHALQTSQQSKSNQRETSTSPDRDTFAAVDHERQNAILHREAMLISQERVFEERRAEFDRYVIVREAEFVRRGDALREQERATRELEASIRETSWKSRMAQRPYLPTSSSSVSSPHPNETDADGPQQPAASPIRRPSSQFLGDATSAEDSASLAAGNAATTHPSVTFIAEEEDLFPRRQPGQRYPRRAARDDEIDAMMRRVKEREIALRNVGQQQLTRQYRGGASSPSLAFY
jgi:hypothetical protein